MSKGLKRPSKFPNLEEFTDKVAEYFDYAEENEKPFTYSGLCIFLGTSKSTLTRYRQTDGYKEVLEFASLRIENFIEESILTNKVNVTGGIFNLKNNYGWTDKREEVIDTTNKVVFKFDRKESIIND